MKTMYLIENESLGFNVVMPTKNETDLIEEKWDVKISVVNVINKQEEYNTVVRENDILIQTHVFLHETGMTPRELINILEDIENE